MRKKRESTKNQLWYLPRSVVIEEVRERSYLLISVIVIAIALLALIIWSAFFKINETANTFGDLQPIGNIHSVQHLEGGIVKEILVRDGDNVQVGQPLLLLDQTASQSELQELQARRLSLLSDVARLKAFQAENAEKTLGNSSSEAHSEELKQILADDSSMLTIQNSARENQRAVILSQIQQNQDDIKKLTEQTQLLTKSIQYTKDELKMYEQLLPKGYVSKRDYLRLSREYVQNQNQYTQAINDLAKAKNSLIESQNKLKELDSGLQKDAITQLADANSQLAEVTARIKKLSDQVQRTIIKAPIAGMVKGLKVTQGSVLKPGDIIMNIVPDNEPLEVVSKLNTRDVAFVQIGAPAKVKILTYDFARYGYIHGTVTQISATTFVDSQKENAQPYYEVKIALDQQYVKSPENKLKPGMTAQADIVTGQKTLLQYLLKPIHLISDRALRER